MGWKSCCRFVRGDCVCRRMVERLYPVRFGLASFAEKYLVAFINLERRKMRRPLVIDVAPDVSTNRRGRQTQQTQQRHEDGEANPRKPA